jgi:hypothetical protein
MEGKNQKKFTHLLVHTIDIDPLLHQILHDVNFGTTTGLKQRRIASLQEQQQQEKEVRHIKRPTTVTVQDKTRQDRLTFSLTVP